jgi:hydroxyacylglutathione hydrolase
MAAEIRLFPCLTDNFGYLIHDPATKATASIDAPEAAPIVKALEREGWSLTDILVTHHHGDHVGGVAAWSHRMTSPRRSQMPMRA